MKPEGATCGPTAVESALLSAIVETSDDAIVTKDLNGVVTSWNQSAERIFGYTAEEMIGQPILLLIPPGRDEEEPEILRRVRRGERVDHFETIRRRKDGALIDVSVTISPIRDASGVIVGASKVARDITSQKKAAIQSSLLAAIVHSSDDAIVSKDLNGVVTSWNRSAERIFGYTTDEMIGKPITILIPDERQDEEPSILRRIRAGERVDHFETIRRRKDGTLINVSVTISPIRDPEGVIVGASKVARDITDQKRLEERLRGYTNELARQHREKDEFLAMLAHELRNPLAPIRTSLELLRLRPEDPALVGRVRQTLDRQVKNLSRLIEDLLDMSRLTQGKMSPRMERVDLGALVRINCQGYDAHVGNAGLTLHCSVPETPVWVRGDPTRLDQILDNLLENAVKFTAEGGSITVSVSTHGDTATMSVRDTGAGIDPEMLSKLFGVFAQGEQSLARSMGGLGLGLAIAKGLAELHGGDIEAHSEGLGHGAEFRVRFPLEGEPPALMDRPVSVQNTPLPSRILLVEDNKDAADSLADLLRIFGYEVKVAYTGPDGVEAAEIFHPQTVLCDIGLPGLDGYEVARRLRSSSSASARLIAITGYGAEGDTERALEAGFDLHLVKPVDPDKLLVEIGPSPE